MRQRQGNDLQIAEREGAINNPWFGMEITGRNDATIERVNEHAFDVFHGFGIGIDWNRALAQVTETAAIVQAHNMVGMRMSENNGVEPLNVLAQTLDAEL